MRWTAMREMVELAHGRQVKLVARFDSVIDILALARKARKRQQKQLVRSKP